MYYYQQGDVILEIIEDIPNGLKSHNEILAEGEATGHCHRIAPIDLSNVNVFADDKGNLYCEAVKEFTIVHPEHKPVTLPAGKYKVRKVLEYDHFAEETRAVRD